MGDSAHLFDEWLAMLQELKDCEYDPSFILTDKTQEELDDLADHCGVDRVTRIELSEEQKATFLNSA